MKNTVTIGLLIMLISCTGSSDNSAANDEFQNESVTEDKEAQNGTGLKQNGDYSALFNRDKKDCQVLSISELADVVGVPAASVRIEDNGYDNCNFYVTEGDKSTRFYFSVEPWGNKTMLKEIKTAKEDQEDFGKDSRLSQYEISETGDTYLSMHQNRMVRILNETNDNAVIIIYEAKIEPDEKGVEKINRLKDEARDRAYAIANFLLTKYKK